MNFEYIPFCVMSSGKCVYSGHNEIYDFTNYHIINKFSLYLFYIYIAFIVGFIIIYFNRKN